MNQTYNILEEENLITGPMNSKSLIYQNSIRLPEILNGARSLDWGSYLCWKESHLRLQNIICQRKLLSS